VIKKRNQNPDMKQISCRHRAPEFAAARAELQCRLMRDRSDNRFALLPIVTLCYSPEKLATGYPGILLA
jgi:hypothetical protein